MTNTEKVDISLDKIPPVVCPIRNTRALKNQFRLIPRFMPFLSEFVEEVTWDCADQILEIQIAETPRFEAFQWFGTINKRYGEAQKSSFVDLDKDSLRLEFLDTCSHEVASLKFRNMKMIDHKCYLDKNGIDSHVSHRIKVKYSEWELLPHTPEEEPVRLTPDKLNEMTDQEWLKETTGIGEMKLENPASLRTS
jgi:hypothetical protein